MTDTSSSNDFPFRRPKKAAAGAAGARTTDRPAHYRLSAETWAIILDEYRNGATVPELSERWRVSAHALRKRITVHKATKRDWGDQIAIETAKARKAAQEEAKTARAAEAAAAEAELDQALFAPLAADDAHAGKAVVLASVAMIASGRAMYRRMLPEAQGLARLAEVYLRLMDRQDRAEDFETMPLHILLLARFDVAKMRDRFALTPESKYDDPDFELKTAYWERLRAEHEAVREQFLEEQRRTWRAEKEAKQAKQELAALKASIAS